MKKSEYEALEFVSKQICVPFGGVNSVKHKHKESALNENFSKDDVEYFTKFDKLFIELFGKEQFDKCPSFMNKIEFIRDHWDDLK